MPEWAWINALAHRPAGELPELVGRVMAGPLDRRATAIADLAVMLSDTEAAHARQLQRLLFVSAELELLAGRQLPGGTGQLVLALRRRAADPTAPPRR